MSFISSKILLEYIWIDGKDNLRSKTKIIQKPIDNPISLKDIPEWNFDGSSTFQAEGKESDIIIKPCSLYKNPFINYIESYLVMCDCWNKDNTPHISNHRVKLVDTYNNCKDKEPLFGIEQEYILFERESSFRINDSNENDLVFIPHKWLCHDEPGMGNQGPYYCSVGGGVCFGRNLVDLHLEYCLRANLSICGTNAEVMASQWEYQIGPLNPIEVSDQIWISRYILHKVSESFDVIVSFHPKPYKGNWNGSGGHTNFSTKSMRESNGIDYIYDACCKLEENHYEHMNVYGEYNEERLTGLHETSSIHDFSWGVSNRGSSIRIPLNVYNEKCGYLEDRRPSANLNPYLVCEKICSTCCYDL